MNRVGEQRHAIGQDHNHDLQKRRDQQTDEGPLQRPQPTGGGGDRRVDHTVRMPVPVVVAVMVLGILVFRIRETFSSMDVSKLNELKW